MLTEQLAEPANGRAIEPLIALSLHEQPEAQRILEVEMTTFPGSSAGELKLGAFKRSLEPSVWTGSRTDELMFAGRSRSGTRDTARAMSPEVVRQRLTLKPRRRRTLEEHLRGRFPHAVARITGLVFRLPARSPVRKAIVRRSVLQGVAAANRGDYEAAFAVFGASCETTFPAALATLGMESVMRAGRSARIDFERRWRAEWGEFRYVPAEVIDLGDRSVMVVGDITAIGLGSRAAVDTEWAALYEVDAGEVVREQIFLDHGEALEAAGLRE